MTKQVNKIYGYIGLSMKAGKVSFGTDSVVESIEKKKAKLIIIASDCSERTKKNFEKIAIESHIPIIVYGTVDEISKSIGKENKAVIAIKDTSIAKEIEKVINGGDTIG